MFVITEKMRTTGQKDPLMQSYVCFKNAVITLHSDNITRQYGHFGQCIGQSGQCNCFDISQVRTEI